MQLIDFNSRLAAATCALLGAVPAAQAADSTAHPWIIDSSVLFYNEAGNRVRAIEPIINLTRDLGDEHIVNVKLTVDSLTGASPNGASPTNKVQTFTGPSGNGKSYSTPAGEQPLDDSFHDTRTAINAGWQQPVGENSKLGLGLNVSNEFDFQSFGGSLNFARDFNQHNTTLSSGLSFEYDLIKPVGGAPVAGTALIMGGGGEGENENENEGGSKAGGQKSKQVFDVLFGVSQVITPRLVTQFNYSFGRSNGYHTDPYKMLSVVDPLFGTTLGYVYESRPETRLRHSLFGQAKYALGDDVIDASYRFYRDDWGISSHTFDLSWRWEFAAGRHYLQPQVRWYRQTAADFYHHSLVSGRDVNGSGALPTGTHASADPRLAAFTATTFGLKYGFVPSANQEISLRVLRYQQAGTDHPGGAIGIQNNYDLFPETKAFMVQLSWSFTW